MKLSARNILKGIIKEITPGAVDTEVVIEAFRPMRLPDLPVRE